MKFRMLILALAVTAMASLSFGQGATFQMAYHNAAGGSVDWLPLNYDCSLPMDPIANPVLQDGQMVRIMRDRTPANITVAQYNNRLNPTTGCFRQGYEVGDIGYIVGTDGAQYQIEPGNTFDFNSAAIPASTGGFLTDLFEFMGATPSQTPASGAANAGGMRMYLSIGCWDETGTIWTSMYSSADYINIGQGYNEYKCDNYIDPTDPNNENGGNTYFWVCEGVCAPPVMVTCEDNMTPSPLNIPEGSQVHGDVNDPDQFFCVNLCQGHDLELQIDHLKIDEYPIVNVLPGCLHGQPGCDIDCPPAVFAYSPTAWIWHAIPGTQYGYYTNVIIVIGEGCACVQLEDILSVEMGAIDITPRDASVELTWTSLAETHIDYYNVVRNGELRATINATAEEGAGATYTYTDEARNGVTYNYSLISVDNNGSETVLREAEATPNANLAVITEYALHQNYPNPFNPTTSIVFDVVEDNHVTLTVYNAMGQQVAVLVNGTYGNGRHSVEFSSDNLTSGLYFYTVKIGNEFTATKKMLLVK